MVAYCLSDAIVIVSNLGLYVFAGFPPINLLSTVGVGSAGNAFIVNVKKYVINKTLYL